MALIALLAVALVFVFGINQFLLLKKAHSTFENYYAFRGCVQLLNKADDYGVCQIASGQVIKIVKFRNKWYLDNYLPIWLVNVCFLTCSS